MTSCEHSAHTVIPSEARNLFFLTQAIKSTTKCLFFVGCGGDF